MFATILLATLFAFLGPATQDSGQRIIGPGVQFPDAPGPRPQFEESPTIRSVDGVLKATLHMR
jgi:hypothetical protein